jgi:hypothetical protein
MIARLKAELAAATAKKPGRKRSTPVTPNGPQQVIVQPPPTALPADQPLPFTQQATNGSAPETDEEEGDEPADLQSRIDNLLKPTGGPT